TPYEIWLTDFDDGLRKQYIGLFAGQRDLLVSVVLRRDGSVVWNFMQGKDKSMNNNRMGSLLYGK
ncbi:MAG: PBECR2 nuclease fold domain-containing protein, partial [Syntrophales bacterium]|nr:PBECR2 nuclease fold domain-containing protein [Syntrophales bacterium]